MGTKENMNLARLLERNLLEVFGETDATRRAKVIAELYAADCTFFEVDEEIVGREALNDQVEHIRKGAPGFAFVAASPAQVIHDVARLSWRFGPPGEPPVVTGMDVAFFEQGKIQALYTFLDKPQGV